MADYINPFSAYDPSTLGGSGQGVGYINPLQTMYATRKMDMAEPFIQRAGQSDQLDLQKKQAENAEFMSPDAAATRKAEMMFKGAQATQGMRKLPWETDKAISDAQSAIELQPHLTKQKIAEAKNLAEKARNTPYEAFNHDLGGLWQMEKDGKISKEMMPLMYEHAVSKFQREHPDTQLPENLKHWNEESAKHLTLGAAASLYSSDYFKSKMTADIAAKAHVQGAQIAGGAAIAVGAGHDAASRANNRDTIGSKEDASVDRRAKLETDAVTKLVTSFPYMQATPQEREKMKSDLRKEVRSSIDFHENGGTTPSAASPSDNIDDAAIAKLPKPPAGKIRVRGPAGVALIPESQWEDAKKQGYSKVD